MELLVFSSYEVLMLNSKPVEATVSSWQIRSVDGDGASSGDPMPLQLFCLEDVGVSEGNCSFLFFEHEGLERDEAVRQLRKSAGEFLAQDETSASIRERKNQPGLPLEDPDQAYMRDTVQAVCFGFLALERRLLTEERKLDPALDFQSVHLLCREVHSLLNFCCYLSTLAPTGDGEDHERVIEVANVRFQRVERLSRQFQASPDQHGFADATANSGQRNSEEMRFPWVCFNASAFNGIEIAIGSKIQAKIHIWPERQLQKHETPHDHCRHFWSYALAGSYRQTIFHPVEVADNENDSWFYFKKKEVGRPIHEFRKGSKSATMKPVLCHNHKKGDLYYIHSFAVHAVSLQDFESVVTLVVQDRHDTNPAMRCFAPDRETLENVRNNNFQPRRRLDDYILDAEAKKAVYLQLLKSMRREPTEREPMRLTTK